MADLVWGSHSVVLFQVEIFVRMLNLKRFSFIFIFLFYRDDTLAFHGELGEQQVFTGDVMITAESVLQFEVYVCHDEAVIVVK